MKSLLFLLFSALPVLAGETGHKLVEAARRQIDVTTGYDPAYVVLAYPGGDVPRARGVCTDVVIRAVRDGLAQDLQRLVHEDMRANFAAYPKQWGLTRPDRNIDHRRVPNLQTWFKRRGFALPVSRNAADYQAGDFVTCTVPPHLPHIMIVSDRKTADGRPLVIHNIGGGTREEDVLFVFPLTGHYRKRWKRSFAKCGPVPSSVRCGAPGRAG